MCRCVFFCQRQQKGERRVRATQEAKFYPLRRGRKRRVGLLARDNASSVCPASLTRVVGAEKYEVNKEGGELLSAYVRRSSKGRRGVERWQHWQRRKWLLFSSGRLSVACRSDVWDRGERGRVEEKRDGWGTHRQPPSYGFRKINTPSFSSG